MNNQYAAPVSLKDMAVNERPQERLEKKGASALSDTELLAMLLRSGTKGLDVLALSSRLIAEAGSLAGLITWSVNDFEKLKGIGHIKALQLISVMEIARRILSQNNENNFTALNDAQSVYEYFVPISTGLEVEKFWVLCLNNKNRIIKLKEVTSGTVNSSLAHPREVFREAIRNNSTSIICAHNHPSGDPTPSSNDIKVTRQLRDAAKTVSIELFDHIIIGTQNHDPSGLGYYSFQANGLI